MTPINVLLADDHALMRDGISSFLQRIDGIQVVAEASNGLEALEMLKIVQVDIVIMDVVMPIMDGLQATASMRDRYPDIQVLILSSYANQEYVTKAFNSGASGYLLKDANLAELESAIRAITQGGTYLTQKISIQSIDDNYLNTIRKQRPADLLTPRQLDVLKLVAKGYSNHAIARTLCISIKTVDTHRTMLMKRLNIHDVTGLVRFAIRTGLINIDRP